MRRLYVYLTIAAVLVTVGSSLFARASNPWDLLLLDTYAFLKANTLRTNAVFIELDEASIADFGGWPWRRGVHAELIQSLRDASIIVYDISFIGHSGLAAEDAALEAAVREAGNVVLPLIAERNKDTGQLETLLPFGRLAKYAELGHVDTPVQDDGRFRTVYLKAGNANAQFPALGLAAHIVQTDTSPALSGVRPTHDRRERSGLWVRDYANILVPRVDFDSITTITASDLLRGDVNASVWTGRPVFIGISADNLTQKLMPAGFYDRTLADAEIQIQLYEALRQDTLLVPLSNFWTFLNAAVVTLLAGALVAINRSRRAAILLSIGLLTLVITAPLLLAHFGFWVVQGYGLAAALVILAYDFAQRFAFSKRSSELNKPAPRDFWEQQWPNDYQLAKTEYRYCSVVILELDFFDRFVLDFSQHKVSVSLVVVEGEIRSQLAENLMGLRYSEGYRWFALLGASSPTELDQLAARLPRAIARLKIAHPNSTVEPTLTASVGVSSAASDSPQDLVWLVGNAEVALLQAVAQGRNQSVLLN